jgi:ElaB/YqjD/DUF883 family membrane-anchored ribosome-binding protein
MDNETEVIRQQMEGTRTALSEKLEKLENQLTDKVQQAGTTVAETVESVSDTVENVKETVEQTVEAVSHTFDLEWHAKQHPWALLGGAVFVGFLGARMLSRPERSRRRDYDRPPPQRPTPIAPVAANGQGPLGRLEQESSDLKKMGIGMAMGVLREVVARAVPVALGPPIAAAVNGLTVRLGGHPVGESSEHEDSSHEHQAQHGHDVSCSDLSCREPVSSF